MQALLDWFVSFSETIAGVVEYFTGMILDIVKMIWLLGLAATELPNVIAFLPGPIVTILICFLTAAILYKIIGREG